MKAHLIFFFLCVSQLTLGQEWRIVSQNNQNSTNFTPENVWMSPSGIRLSIAIQSSKSLDFLNNNFTNTNNYQVVNSYVDTSFQVINSFHHQRSFSLSPGSWSRYFSKFISDSIVFVQNVLDTNNSLFGYTASGVLIIRGLANLHSNSFFWSVQDDFPRKSFLEGKFLYWNYFFSKDTSFAGVSVTSLTSNYYNYLLKYSAQLDEILPIPLTFLKPDSSVAGRLEARRIAFDRILLAGGTAPSGGRVFDFSIDDANILAITDTLGNKKKVYHASNTTFPYLNYDGQNLYFLCDSRPRQGFIQNTSVPNYCIGRLDSTGLVDWVHRIPPDASMIQDTAFRTYVFGHQRNGIPLFGQDLGNNELYMAVIDSDGTVLHFEHDTNWLWPTSFYYKLLYSPVTGVNLFMSHLDNINFGSLQVPNDSGHQNMFLARFRYIEPEDSSTNNVLEPKQAFEVQLFPNPAKEVIHIRCSETISQLRILDANGKELQAIDKPGSKDHILDIEDLSSGTYFVQLHTKYGIRSKRFVKD